jgi:hypothetical protein
MKEKEVRMDAYTLVVFWIVTLVVTFVCMFLLAAGGTFFFGRPFESKFIAYYTNSILLAMLVGQLLFRWLFEPVARLDWLYGEKWEEQKTSPRRE